MFTLSVPAAIQKGLLFRVPDVAVSVSVYFRQRYMEKFVVEAVEARKQAEEADDGDGE